MGLTKSTQTFVQKMIDSSLENVVSSNVPPGYTSLIDIGCVPDDESVDNAAIINDYYKDVFGNIYLAGGPGTWYARECINSINKVINLIGAGRSQTYWRTMGGRSAYFIMRQDYYDAKGNFIQMDPVTIKGIAFQSPELVTGKVDKVADLAGLRIYHPCVIEDLDIVGFTGGGLQMYGELAYKVNVSGSSVKNCLIANIKGDGVMIVGPDANACLFESLDIRDCTGIGVNDRSFLGNTWKAVMTHNNERSFHVEYLTAKTSFLGCYHETGQKPPALGNIEGGQFKELTDANGKPVEGMFTWDLGATSLKQ